MPLIFIEISDLKMTSPDLLYFIFGRKAILPSALTWQSLLYPPIFARFIDISLGWLFRWYGANISVEQKIAAYAHLYSFASTKSVVHWFQIMRARSFQMFDDDVQAASPLRLARGGLSSTAYVPARFPTRNIATPIVLFWGDQDSLVDIDTMLDQLPDGTRSRRLHTYEHLDIIWGDNVHKDVIPKVIEELGTHATRQSSLHRFLDQAEKL
jgi:lysosomal acid lipase/cholesteryl ester hydrolase